MSELSLATSVPDMHIARPISAYTTDQALDRRIKQNLLQYQDKYIRYVVEKA